MTNCNADLGLEVLLLEKVIDTSLEDNLLLFANMIHLSLKSLLKRQDFSIWLFECLSGNYVQVPGLILMPKEEFETANTCLEGKQWVIYDGINKLLMKFEGKNQCTNNDERILSKFFSFVEPYYKKILKESSAQFNTLMEIIESFNNSHSLLSLTISLEKLRETLRCESIIPLRISSRMIFDIVMTRPSLKIQECWRIHNDTISRDVNVFTDKMMLLVSKNKNQQRDFALHMSTSVEIHPFGEREFRLMELFMPLIRSSVDCIITQSFFRKRSLSSVPQIPRGEEYIISPEEEEKLCSDDLFVPSLDSNQISKLIGYLINELDLCRICKLPMFTIYNFTKEVQQRYRFNEYHNWAHAVSVARACVIMVSKTGFLKQMNGVERLALFCSSLCHDIDHRGMSNSQMEASSSPIGLLFKGLGVMEYHHCTEMIRIFEKQDGINSLLKGFTKEEVNEFWNLSIEMILSTDIGRNNILFPQITKSLSNDEHKKLKEYKFYVLLLIIKIADIYSACSPIIILKKWTSLLFKEGNRIFHEDDPNIVQEEIGFLSDICEPLFELGGRFSPYISTLKDQLESNINYWKNIAEKIK